MKKKTKYSVVAGLVVLLLVFIFVILPSLDLTLLRGETDIDLHTGSCRSKYYFCGFKVGEKFSETEFSELVRELISQEKPPLWKLETEWSDFPVKYSKGGRLLTNCQSFVHLMVIGEYNGQINQELKKQYVHQFLEYLEKADVQKTEEFCTEISTGLLDDPSVAH